MIFCMVSAALWGVQAAEPGMAALLMEIMQGWDKRKGKSSPMFLWSICFSLSLCSQRSVVVGTSGDQLWSSPAPFALWGDKEKLFNSPYTPLNARMDAQPKRLL